MWNDVRAHLAARRDVERVKIKRNAECHCLGIMPNTNRFGWYFAGFADNIRLYMRDC